MDDKEDKILYKLIANVYQKDDESAPDWSLRSSRVKSIHWGGLDAEYPLGLKFSNDDMYVYNIKEFRDRIGRRLGNECYAVLASILSRTISIGKLVNQLNSVPYKKI